MSVDEDSKRSEGVKCLICSKETSHRESSRPGQKCATPEAAQALSDLFQNFAQHMNWNTSDHEFDFCHDPFPFCRSCKELVAEMGHLDNQMGTLLRRMKRITIVAASKIMLSTRDGVDGDESNPAREDEVSYFDEKKRKRLKYSPVEESSVPRLSYRQNVRYFRNETVRSYDPFIQLWKDFDEIAETSKSTNNVCSNLKSKAVMLHHSESEQMNINTVPEFLLGASVVPWSNQKTNGEHVKKKIDERKADCEPGAVKSERKKINQCVKCKRNFSSPGSLSRHQVISCGANNKWNSSVTKINRDTYLYDEFPFTKTKNGFRCDTCRMDLKKLPNLKYHIRRNHSNSAFSEVKEDRNVLVEPKGRKGPERLQGKKEKKVVRGKCLNKKNHSNILKTYANLFNMRAKY